MEEPISYIVNGIYVEKEMESLCKKSPFIKLFSMLRKGCVFSVNGKLLKQVHTWPMCGSISIFFSDIYTSKMEFDVAIPTKSLFYKHYVDDTHVRRKKNARDVLFDELNSYRQIIKLT